MRVVIVAMTIQRYNLASCNSLLLQSAATKPKQQAPSLSMITTSI